ncbi:MAG: R3H domain-containing nucleic acid-binding protein, partial [Dehalococcoidia bacterium]
IGHARRMQVPSPTMQHAVMIEAVENHMPEVIIIDEIGTSLEADAARTIAERGVQLIGTAHGNSLENLMMNPTLSDLIGGIQTVTLGDDEARRRRTQKSVLERKAPPTFDIVVEMQDRDRVIVHPDVTEAVDTLLHSKKQNVETRWLDEHGEVHRGETTVDSQDLNHSDTAEQAAKPVIYLFGINSHKLEEIAKEKNVHLSLTNNLKEANLFLTTKNYYRRKPQKIRDAESAHIPIYALKSNNVAQLRHCIETIYLSQKDTGLGSAMEEAELAVHQVRTGTESVDLSPQNSYVRRLQHILVREHDLDSQSFGKGSQRRVTVHHKTKFGQSHVR